MTATSETTSDEKMKTPEKRPPSGPLGFVREVVELVVMVLVLLIAIRWAIAEARYIPSSSMEPTLQIEDRLLVEKISGHLRRPFQRGEILVFYPPPSQMPGGKDLSNDPLSVLGRLTGLPFLPSETAYIKRVIGIPGDTIRVQKGVGVFVNEQLLSEDGYAPDAPQYDLKVMGDIGADPFGGGNRPYGDSKIASTPIKVPPGHLFMMGDNRNNSQDSHAWGFLPQDRVIGRAWLLFWRQLQIPPTLSKQIIDRVE